MPRNTRRQGQSGDSLTIRGKADLYAFALAIPRAEYLRTGGNPIYAWRAYRAARAARVPVPDWVLDYFDQVATTLAGLRDATPEAIAEALGLRQRGGGTGKPEQARNHDRNERMIVAIDARLDRGDPITRVITDVATTFHLSPDRVRHIYRAATTPTRPQRRPLTK